MAFTKRIYTSRNKIFIYGSGTLLILLSLLISLSYLGINIETSGDIECLGTQESPCISYFNISLANYSLCLGSTFKGIYFDKNATAEIFKADQRYRSDNPNRWKPYNFTAGKCLDKNKKHEFMIKGYKNPYNTIKWALNLQGKDVDPYWIGIKEPRPRTSLITTEIDKEMTWNITTSGIDKNLKINYKNLNDTTTEFCVDFINKTKYETDLIIQKKDIKKIPIEKLSTDSARLQNTEIDLSKENQCFYVYYPEKVEGITIELGFNSVRITNGIDTDATEGTARNIYRDPYGGLNVAYTSLGSDMGFARSTDNGATWTAAEIAIGTFDDFGMTGNSTTLLLYWRDSADVDGKFSTDNGTSWSAVTTLMDATATLTDPVCKVDSNNIFHCLAIDATSYRVYYTNSTAWNTETQIFSSAATVHADIEIGDSNCVYALLGEQAGADSLQFATSCNAWTPDTIASTLTFNPHISISVVNDTDGTEFIAVTYGDSVKGKSVVCEWIGAWDCVDRNNSYENNPEIAITNDYNIILLTTSSATTGGSTNITYFESLGDWSTSVLNSKADYPSVADQRYPTTAKISDTAHIVYTNASGIYYSSYPMITDNIYPTFSGYWDDNASLLDNGIGHFNVTVIDTNGTVKLNINGQSVIATNLTPSVYNASYNFTTGGTYTYNWTAYGNGTNKNLNTSTNRYYTVNSSGCGVLSTANEIHLVTADISSTSTCFTISANNVTLDCQGHTVDGNDGLNDYGVDARDGFMNHTIKNCWFTDWDIGIWGTDRRIKILNVNVTSSRGNGIRLEDAANHNLTNVRTDNNGHTTTSAGLYLTGINDSYFTNIISDNNTNPGIDMTQSSNRNTFRNVHTADNDAYGIVAELSSKNNYYNGIISHNNTAGIVINVFADNTTIINITTYLNAGNGIWIANSTNSTVTNATTYNNSLEGVILGFANSNKFINLNSYSNGNNGFLVAGSSYNNLTGGTITNNIDGVWIQAYQGTYSTNNYFMNVISSGNDHGIYFGNASYSTLTNSTFKSSTSYGIKFVGAFNNTVYNNLFNNTVNVDFDGVIYYNSWNTTSQAGSRIVSNGTNIGGNYYTNSSGTGYSDTCTDANTDGFCDSPYNVTTLTACTAGSTCGLDADYLTLSNDYAITDTCTYSSGDWNVNCADNCTITSNVNLGGNNIIFSSSGSFTVQANITSINNWQPLSTNCKLMICTKCIFG